MKDWPEDTLIIHYATLASIPEERLHVLGLIGLLLNNSTNSNTEVSLNIVEEDWLKLCLWIERKENKLFWFVEFDVIQVHQVCKSHVVIGTNLLLSDLGTVIQNREPLKQASFGNVWEAVRQYIASEVIKKA